MVTALIGQACWTLTWNLLTAALWFIQQPLSRTVAFIPWKNNVNLLDPLVAVPLDPQWRLSRFSEHRVRCVRFILVPFGRWQDHHTVQKHFFSNTGFRYSVLFYFPMNHQRSSGNSVIFISAFSPRQFFALVWQWSVMTCTHVLSGKYASYWYID